MKDSRSWSHISARATDGSYLRNFLPVRPKTALGIRKRRRKWQLQSVLRYMQMQQKLLLEFTSNTFSKKHFLEIITSNFCLILLYDHTI